MRKLLFFLLIFPLIVFAQSVSVVSDTPVTALNEGAYYFPLVSPDGSGVFFTNAHMKGLWFKNFHSGNVILATDAPGAGYEPTFNSTGNVLYFRENTFINGKMSSSIKSFDIASQKISVIQEGIRDLKISKSYNDKSDNYVKGSVVFQLATEKSSLKKTLSKIIAYADYNKIMLVENGIKRSIDPIGNGKYIWISLSPDNSKILFTSLGKGTFICSLDGKILKQIGYANYPSWSVDGNWILFMKDIDDGVKLISSDVFVANINTGKYFNLTSQQSNISMYPKWGNNIGEIYYNTNNGQIRKINLKLE